MEQCVLEVSLYSSETARIQPGNWGVMAKEIFFSQWKLDGCSIKLTRKTHNWFLIIMIRQFCNWMKILKHICQVKYTCVKYANLYTHMNV